MTANNPFSSPNQGCEGFFNQLTSYVILLDLLYEAEKFGEVITVFEDLLSRGVFANSYPRDMVCLVFAAAYRIGTPEAYNKAKKIATDARKAESFLSSRAICLMAAMAIRHGDPETGFELLAILRTQNYIARNIKLVTLCHLKRPDDALMLARSYLARDRGEGKFSGGVHSRGTGHTGAGGR